jgi:hypothetical protein
VTGPHIIANLDGKVPDNSTPLANEATVANGHDAFRNALLTRNHPGRQGALGTNHGVATYMDEVLIENCVRRKTNHTLLAE